MEDIVQQLKMFEALETYINQRVTERVKESSKDYYESEKTDQICAALAKAQGEFPIIVTNRSNNYLFRQYSDLDIVVHSVRAALKENGLSITFQERLEDDKTILSTKVRHESAQWIESRTRILPSKNDIETYKSTIQEKKKVALMNLLNLTIQGDPTDDDGEWDMKTVREERAKGTALNVNYTTKRESFETIDAGEERELQRELDYYPDIAEKFMETYKIEAIADLPKSKFGPAIKQVREIIEARKGRVNKT